MRLKGVNFQAARRASFQSALASEVLHGGAAGSNNAHHAQIPYLAVERQSMSDCVANRGELIPWLISADRQVESPCRIHRIGLAGSAQHPLSPIHQRPLIVGEQTNGVSQDVDVVQSVSGPPRFSRELRQALTRKLVRERPGTGKRQVRGNPEAPRPVSLGSEIIDDCIGLDNGQEDALEGGVEVVGHAAKDARLAGSHATRGLPSCTRRARGADRG